MLRNTLTFKFGKTIGLFYLICTAAGIFTITAEKIYYLIRHTQIPDYGLSFAVILLLNAFVIFVANFFAIEIILAVIDCFRIQKSLISQNQKQTYPDKFMNIFYFQSQLLYLRVIYVQSYQI